MAIAPDATLTDFRNFFPEFDSVPDASINLYLNLYNGSLDGNSWQECFTQAVLYRSAHELALSQNRQANTVDTEDGFVTTSSGAGAITQAAAGGISASYAQSATSTQGSDADNYFTLTQYGQQYLALKRECMPYGIQAGFSCQ